MTRATSASVHEAGHAIVAELLGEPVDLISRHRSGSTVGATWMRRPDDADLDAVIALAGPWAESRHSGRPLFQWAPGWESGGSDLDQARSRVPTGRDAFEWLALRAEVAEHLLDQHWDEVVEVAERLDVAPVSGQRIRSILRGERPPWPRPKWATELLKRAGYTPGAIEHFIAPADMSIR